MTWKCPICGAPCVSPKEASTHCASNPHYSTAFSNSGRVCPDCKGSGEKLDFFNNRVPCPRCGGRGTI